MFRDYLGLGVGVSVEMKGSGAVGLRAVIGATLGVVGGLACEIGVGFPIQRRFKYPLGGLQSVGRSESVGKAR